MAVRTDIQYVQFYVDGNTARKAQAQTQVKHAATPKYRKAKRKVVVVDPVAVVGAVVTVCLMVAMLVGFVQFQNVQSQSRQMEQYLAQLQEENQQLEQTYRDGYDLEQIQQIAAAAGMIPAGEAQQIQLQVQIPQDETVTQMTLWESFTTFLAGLFA